MQRLKICFVTEDFYPAFIGGQGIYGWKFVSKLAKNGHTLTVLAEKRAKRKEFWYREKNVSIILTPFCFGNQILLAIFEYCLFRFKLSSKYFDILHANQLSGLFFVLFRPKNVGKIVISVHNTNYDMEKKTDSIIKKILYQPLIFLERIVYRKADGLLFNSPNEQKNLIQYYQIKDKPTKAVYLGVDVPLFTMQEKKTARIKIRKDLNLSTDAKIVLYVGRLVKRKNVDLLIKSLELIGDKNVVGLIIGDGVERKRLEKMATSNVRILGFVADTRLYFLAADVFVTVSDAEGGFLLSALEVASFGLPLILSSSAAGFPIIKEGVNGYIVEPDSHGLAEKIQMALKKSKKMEEKSRSMVQQFTWQRCAKETNAFYQSILEKQRHIF